MVFAQAESRLPSGLHHPRQTLEGFRLQRYQVQRPCLRHTGEGVQGIQIRAILVPCQQRLLLSTHMAQFDVHLAD